MNGYERILAVLEHRPADHLGFLPITMMYAADQIGKKYGEYTSDYRVLVEAQLETAKRIGANHVSCISDPGREAADCGATVLFFDDQPPAIDETNALLADKERLKTLSVPNPYKEGSRMFDRIQAAERFAEKVKGQYFIEGWIEGPCAEAADLRGINQLMTDLIDDPVFVQELFAFNVKMGTAFAEAQIKAGCDIIGVGDAAASLVGPRFYRDVVFPYEKQLVDNIHRAGGRVRLHICGNTSKSMTEIGKLGCDLVDLDWMVPVNKARQETGADTVLDGNLDPVKIVRNGTPEQIQAALQTCFEQADKKNYITGAGCEIPRDTALENILAMRDFAKERIMENE